MGVVVNSIIDYQTSVSTIGCHQTNSIAAKIGNISKVNTNA